MRQRNNIIYNYMDDLMGIGKADTIFSAYHYLLKLLKDLGFPISNSKLVSPTNKCNCLGIIIDTKECTLSVPPDKLQEVLTKCKAMYRSSVISLKNLQSLLGSLMFIHKCVKNTRVFINRLLDTLRNCDTNQITITSDMRRDLTWLQTFLPIFNGTTTYNHCRIEQNETLHIDACLEGVGGVWK